MDEYTVSGLASLLSEWKFWAAVAVVAALFLFLGQSGPRR